MNKEEKKFRVVELFAGVGGFHLGLQKAFGQQNLSVWANQWEPGDKAQHAYKCYIEHFGSENSTNDDIGKVRGKVKKHDLLVGGFPCQDYSVATANANGITGKKGVLWWDIEYILSRKEKQPPFVLLENVDRLLRSPAKQRGRDFGIILACLYRLGYHVEWRVINAADYGFPQRRRRTFIFATKDKKTIKKLYYRKKSDEIVSKSGFFAQEFPVDICSDCEPNIKSLDKIRNNKDVKRLSKEFEMHFYNSGVMIKGDIFTYKVVANKGSMRKQTLNDVLENEVGEEFCISESDISSKNGWKYCKGPKDEPRMKKTGYAYRYKEGAIPFPDKLDEPSRTMLTGEGNKRPNRISHVIKDPTTGRLRIITPIEAERLNGFPDNWTNTGMPQRWRYFCMGNALVVGLIEMMGSRLKKIIEVSNMTRKANKIELYVRFNHQEKENNKLVRV
jgi:DNA (cytosine-5)-methyltransferase 1